MPAVYPIPNAFGETAVDQGRILRKGQRLLPIRRVAPPQSKIREWIGTFT